MLCLSLSIGEMRAIVGIVALGCLAIWAGRSPQSAPYLILGGLPLQSALVIGLFIMIRRRSESRNRFLFYSGSRSSAGLFI